MGCSPRLPSSPLHHAWYVPLRGRAYSLSGPELSATAVSRPAGGEQPASLSAPLFLNVRGQPATAASIRARIRALAERAGIGRRVTPHMFRHTAATALIEAGVDIRFVQRLLGHQSIATTQLYTHVSDRALKAAIMGANTRRYTEQTEAAMPA